MRSLQYAWLFLLIWIGLASCQGTPSTPRATPPAPAAAAPSTPVSGQPTGVFTTQLPEKTAHSPTPAPATTNEVIIPMEDVSGLPGVDELEMGWNQIDPGGATSCAYGGKYSFFVRKTDSDKLLIYFEGGGSCFSAETCAVGSNAFDGSIDPNFQADNPALKDSGVFALGDERNPFKDYNIVFVNYCTGDGHTGSKTVTYQKSGQSFQVNHFGAINDRLVLSWTYQNFTRPASLFVMGCSAGTGGSYFHAPYLLEQYRGIPSTLVGDSGGGFMDGPKQIVESLGFLDMLPSWMPQYRQLIDGDVLRGRYLFSIPVLAYPNTRFALLDTLGDEVQAHLLAQFSLNRTLAQVIQTNLKDIRAEAPGLLSYTGPGNYHCIAEKPVYYDYQVNGVGLNQWITALANGQTVQNVTP